MKQIILLSIVLSIAVAAIFINFEPELITAATNVQATSTVTLTVDSELTMTGPAAITMSPNITMTQDTSVGTATMVVATNDTDGYTLNLRATNSPAMRSTADPTVDFFDDYSEGAYLTPESWAENANEYEFGYSVFGTDTDNVNTPHWDNDSEVSCGSPDAAAMTSNLNWLSASTTQVLAASRTATTTQAGVTTTLCVGAEQGSNVFAPSGTYEATLEATAVVQ